MPTRAQRRPEFHSGDNLNVTPLRTICTPAQRRPEFHSGDNLGMRRKRACGSITAQRRPEFHSGDNAPSSTRRRAATIPLNEGRNFTPATTQFASASAWYWQPAQRRPEFHSGDNGDDDEFVAFGYDAQRRPEFHSGDNAAERRAQKDPATRSTKAGISLRRQPVQTRARLHGRVRSTKAGISLRRQRRIRMRVACCRRPLNEGRNFTPATTSRQSWRVFSAWPAQRRPEFHSGDNPQR